MEEKVLDIIKKGNSFLINDSTIKERLSWIKELRYVIKSMYGKESYEYKMLTDDFFFKGYVSDIEIFNKLKLKDFRRSVNVAINYLMNTVIKPDSFIGTYIDRIDNMLNGGLEQGTVIEVVSERNDENTYNFIGNVISNVSMYAELVPAVICNRVDGVDIRRVSTQNLVCSVYNYPIIISVNELYHFENLYSLIKSLIVDDNVRMLVIDRLSNYIYSNKEEILGEVKKIAVIYNIPIMLTNLCVENNEVSDYNGHVHNDVDVKIYIKSNKKNKVNVNVEKVTFKIISKSNVKKATLYWSNQYCKYIDLTV